MGFQSSVFIQMGFGVPGELYADAPWKAETYTINSALASYNIIGATACSVTSQGFCAAGAPVDNLGFAGILVDPKAIALYGIDGAPLAPTLTVPNFAIVECLTMGTIVVTLPSAAGIGDNVIFDNTTGALSTIAQGVALPSGKTFANAVVDYYSVSEGGLAVISVSPTYVIPQPA